MKLNYGIIALITIGVAWLGSFLTAGGIQPGWYADIVKPAWTPDGSVIGTVWTIIFILSAFSAGLAWNRLKKSSRRSGVVAIFLINAFLNVLWSFIFFNQHLLWTAVWEAGLLAVSVIALIILLWPKQRLAASLLFPYALWVIFATYLTSAVAHLN